LNSNFEIIDMNRKKTDLNKGFSLIEVTIAMAIASVALVTLIGMLPQGMDTMREAGDMAIEARIHQQILSEIQMADFDRLDDYDQMEVYYDTQGEELGSTKGGNSSAKGSFDHIYSARVSVPSQSGGTTPQSVGASSFSGVSFDGNNGVNERLRVVIMEIAAVGGRGSDFDWDADANRSMISTYQTFVVDMGQDFTK